MLACVCAALWQAASFLEILSRTRGRPRPADAALPGTGLPGLESLGGPGREPDSASAARLRVGTAVNGSSPGDMVVFTPNGSRLTDAEREALAREAERNRPKPPTESAGPKE